MVVVSLHYVEIRVAFYIQYDPLTLPHLIVDESILSIWAYLFDETLENGRQLWSIWRILQRIIIYIYTNS